jgi:hypothetical protein
LVYDNCAGTFVVIFPYMCIMYPSWVHPFRYSPFSLSHFLK